MKWIRGSWAEPFGRSPERRAERALRDEYLQTIGTLCDSLDRHGLAHPTAIAALPDMVRGYGPVKEAAMAAYKPVT
jgi:indolepyruvate ferredoxin oxidoreductase